MINRKVIIFTLQVVLIFIGNMPFVYAQSEAESALNKGKILHNQAQYDSAIVYFEKAADLFQHEDKTVGFLDALNWLGFSYMEVSFFAKADSILNFTLATGIESLGPSHPSVAFSYHLKARLTASNGQYDQSNDLERKVLRIRLGHYGPQDTLVAESYNMFAFNYRLKGYYDSALFYYNKALGISEKILGADHLKTSLIYSGLGWVYGAKGELATSLNHNLKALEIQKGKLGNEHPTVANTLQTIAWCYNTLGDYSKAIEYYEKTIEIRKKTLGPDHPNIGHSYHGLGLAHHYLGDNNKAIQYHVLGNSIIEKKQGDKQPILVRYYNFLGDHLMETGKYDRAFAYLNKAEALASELEKDHPELVQTYILQAKRYGKLQQSQKQWEYLQKALMVSKTKFGESHHFTSKVLTRIATYQADHGKVDSAIPNFIKAVEILKANFGERHPDVAHQSLFLGRAYEQDEKYRKALEVYHGALVSTTDNFTETEVLKTPSRSDIVSEFAAVKSLVDKARVLVKLADREEAPLTYLHPALDSYGLAIELIDYLKNIYTTEEAKKDLYKSASDVYKNALSINLRVYELTRKDEFLQRAFSASEKSKAFILINAINDHRARNFGGVPDSLLEKQRLLNMELIYLKKRLYYARSKEDTSAIKKCQADISAGQIALDRLIREMEKQSPRYFQLKFDNRTTTYDEVKNKVLDDETALIEYFISDSTIYAFSLTKDEVNLYEILKSPQFEDDIKTYRKVTGDLSYILNNKEGSDKKFIHTAYAIYDLLLEDPVSDLPGSVKKLIIVNDGVLNQINFESLLTEPWSKSRVNYSELPFLLKKYSISYAYSATFLSSNYDQQKKHSVSSFLGFAPSYRPEDRQGIIPNSEAQLASATNNRENSANLEGATLEVRSISRLFDSDLWIGPDATETNFKQHVADYSILHLAMHGSLNDIDPLYSSLLFAHETDSANDGNLDLFEIYNLRLNAELTVLSACNTGSGKLQHGEGNMSISRAFSYAGCPSVVMSLWKIPDDATAEIMVHFYENLGEGMDKDEALRHAKISFLSDEHDPIYHHPFFWAGFILSGETDAIHRRPGFTWIVLSAFALLLISGLVYFYLKQD